MFIRKIWGKFSCFTREISKFQKSELDKFIPNFPLKHVITSTKQWAHERSINPNLEEIDAESLDEVLSQFYGEIRKQDGRQLERDSLCVIQSSLYRYLSENGYKKCILKDQVFNESLKILESIARLLRE